MEFVWGRSEVIFKGSLKVNVIYYNIFVVILFFELFYRILVTKEIYRYYLFCGLERIRFILGYIRARGRVVLEVRFFDNCFSV